MIGGAGGKADQRPQPPAGHQVVERVLQSGRIAQDQRTLAEVVEHEAGQDQAEPGEADRGGAEVAHVGVERLGAGDRQHDRPQRHEGLPAGVPEQPERVGRVQRREHARVLDDLRQAEDAEGGEPDQHHRAEEGAHGRRPAALDHEQAEEHERRERHDVGLERRGRGLQALDRGEDRDGGGDQAVAVEQRQPGDGQGGDQGAERGRARHRPGGEGAQRQHPALAPVVGAQDEDDVLERDDQDQRPEHEREHAQHGGLAQVQPAGVAERLAQRVERAGADVAVDDAERRQHQRAPVARRVTRRSFRAPGRRRRVHPRAPLSGRTGAATPLGRATDARPGCRGSGRRTPCRRRRTILAAAGHAREPCSSGQRVKSCGGRACQPQAVAKSASVVSRIADGS